MSMSSLFGIGTSALNAFRRALDTTGHNIANASTEGYSRQQIELAARPPQYAGFGYLGAGVDTKGVRRIYNGFLEQQVRAHTASSKALATFEQFANKIDNVLADSDAGMNASLQRFSSALQDLANDPTSSATRQVVLDEGQGLVNRFSELDGWLRGIGREVDSGIQTSVNDINQLTAAIADLNHQIVVAKGVIREAPPNDLLDQRDNLIRQLSEKVSVTTLTQDDGAVNVMVGNGQALVVGNQVTKLVAYRGDGIQSPVKVGLSGGANGTVAITEQLSGGELGGLLDFRNRMLDPTINALGRVALGVGRFINDQHHQGTDLNGASGQDFFTIGQPQWSRPSGVSGSINLGWDDVSKVTGAEYRLAWDGSAWSLTRTDTGQPVTMTGSGTAADPFIADGLRIEVPATPGSGDSFLLQPVRNAAGDLRMNLSDPSEVAASQSGGVGDNANALALAGVMRKPLFSSPSESIDQAYQRLVADVGSTTRQTSLAATAQQKLMERAVAQREEASGVNLDEEAANLVRYQQAYQAAARVIKAADDMFQALLQATRG